MAPELLLERLRKLTRAAVVVETVTFAALVRWPSAPSNTRFLNGLAMGQEVLRSRGPRFQLQARGGAGCPSHPSR